MAPRAAIHDPDVGRLTDRASRILAALVTQYIDRGEPVSSLWLAQHDDVGLSSASVRNVMAELEQAGYISQPHTSAGRIPTDRGYRYFVRPPSEPPAGHRPAGRRRGAAAAGRYGGRRPVERVARAFGRVSPTGVRLPSPRGRRHLPAHRVRAAGRHQDPRGGHDRRRGNRAQGGRPGRGDRPPRTRAGRPLPVRDVRRPAAVGRSDSGGRAVAPGADALRPAPVPRVAAGQPHAGGDGSAQPPLRRRRVVPRRGSVRRRRSRAASRSSERCWR